MKPQLLYSALIAAFAGAAPTLSHAAMGIALGGGTVSAETRDGRGDDGSVYQFSFVWDLISFQEESGGMSYFLGVVSSETDGAEVPGYGETSFQELSIPVGLSYRINRVSLLGFVDIRDLTIETDTSGGDTSAWCACWGIGIRFPFGAAGTVPGRFAFRSTYVTGEGSFDDPITFNSEEDLEVSDVKLAVDYSLTGNWLFRLEHRVADYTGSGDSPLFDQDITSTMLIVGYNF